MAILDTQPTNKNFLSPLGFRFILSRTPNIEYFCQAATLPNMVMAEALTPNPFLNNPAPGTKISFEPFDIRFRVDEDMKNYQEIYDWLIGLGFPDNFSQYKDIAQSTDGGLRRTASPSTQTKAANIYSDGSLVILTSNNNANIRIAFFDLFPVALTALEFDVTQTEIAYLEATASFRYRKFIIEDLNT